MNENPTPEPNASATPFDALASPPAAPTDQGTASISTSPSATEAASAPLAAASFENEVAQQIEAAPPEVAASTAAPASTSTPIGATDDPTDDTAREAPRALSPGALLQGDFEIKEVLARGLTNLYRADTGGYGPSEPWLVAERVLVAEPPSPTPAASPSAAAVAPSSATVPPSAAAVAPPSATVPPSTGMIPPTPATVPPTSATVAPSAGTIAPPGEAVAPALTAVAPAPAVQAAASAAEPAPIPAPAAVAEASAAAVPAIEAAPEVPPAPQSQAADSSAQPQAAPEIPLSEIARSSGMPLTDSGEFERANESGGLASESGVFDAPIEVMAPLELSPTLPAPPSAPATSPATAIVVESDELYLDPEPLQPVHLRPADVVRLDSVTPPPAQAEEEEELEDVPALLMPGEVWEQDGRQYCAWEWAETTSLQDFRDSTNDEHYFQVLGRVAEAMVWQKQRGRVLGLNRDTLRFDESGNAHFYGFSSPLHDESELLSQLRGVNEFLLKHTFANSGTMRLDDPFAGLPLAEETKAFAHKLSEGEFASFEEAHEALQVLAGPDEPEMSVALITDVGRERELNEDSGLIARCSRKTMLSPMEWELFVVADGMGGHEGGEIASDLTVRVLHQQLLEATWDWKDNAEVRAGLLAAIMAANARVAALAEAPKYKGSRSRPGSTLTFAVRVGRRVWIGNVGDSRTYIFRDNELMRVTKDHSYVQNLIDAGALDAEDAWDHPDGSIITAHIGEANLKTRDLFMRLLLPGDKLLLVSDGVIDMLRDRDIAPFLQHSQPGAICRGLVDAANAAGGADNITALCLCCY